MTYENPGKRLGFLQEEVLNPNSEIYLENLLDLAVSVTYDIHSSGTWKNSKPIKSFLDRYQNFSDKVYKSRVSVTDFKCIKTIGQGGFGRVDLVEHKETKNVYAMKVIEKSTYIQNAFNGFWEERDILAKNVSDWLVKCFYTFMDLKKLYIVMEYMPGGNLYHWLSTLEEFNDEQTHFYAIEMMLAVETLHNMEFLHRDLKPDNMLLDKNGHLKLADFGTCIKVDQGKVKTNFQVGTPDYIAPEVLSKAGVHDLEVGFEIDWWAFGIVLYELYYGETPFDGESTSTLYNNIMLYKTTLCYPDDKPASDNYLSFLKGLLTESGKRMKIDAIKSHPYITNAKYGWTTDNIKQHQTPIIFEVSDEADTQYITFDPNDKRSNIASSFSNNNFFSGENLAFTGFTFNRSHRYGMDSTSTVKPTNVVDSSRLAELQLQLSEAESSKQLLSVRLEQNVAQLGQIQAKLSSTERELSEKGQLLAGKSSEHSQYSEENILLKGKIEVLTRQYETSQQEVTQLNVSISEKESVIKTMKAEITNMTESNSSLKLSLQQSEQQLKAATADLEEKIAQLEVLSRIEGLLEDEKNLNKDMTADINTKQRKIVEYEKQLEQLNDRIKELNEQIMNSWRNEANNNEQIQELELLRQKYDQVQRDKAAVESNLKLITGDLKEIKDDRDLIRSEMKTEQLKKTALEKTKDKLNKELLEKTAQFKTLQNKIYETEDQMRIMKQKINISESEKEQLENSVKMYENMAVVKRIELEEAKEEFDESKEEYEARERKLESEKRALHDQLMATAETLEQLRVEYDLQTAKLCVLESLEKEKSRLSALVDNLKTEVSEKRAEVETLTETNESVQEDLKKSRIEIAQYKVKVEQAVTKLNDVLANPNSMKSFRAKKEPDNKESSKRVKQLENDINKLKATMEHNRNEEIGLKNECQGLREKCKGLEQEMERKNSVIEQLRNKIGGGDDPMKGDGDGDYTRPLKGRIEMLKKAKGRHKIQWNPFFAVLRPFQMEIFVNEGDATPTQTIDIRDVIYVKETTQADSVHIDKALLPQMLQIICSKPGAAVLEDGKRSSVMPGVAGLLMVSGASGAADGGRRTKGSMLLNVDDHGGSMRSLSSSTSTLASLSTSSTSTSTSTPSIGIILAQNHSFVHVKCWGSQICDICHLPCKEMFSGNTVLECSKCKQRIHPDHVRQDAPKIPACQEALENVSIKLESAEARTAWLQRIRQLKQFQDGSQS